MVLVQDTAGVAFRCHRCNYCSKVKLYTASFAPPTTHSPVKAEELSNMSYPSSIILSLCTIVAADKPESVSMVTGPAGLPSQGGLSSGP